MVAHAFDPSTQEGSLVYKVPGHPSLHKEPGVCVTLARSTDSGHLKYAFPLGLAQRTKTKQSVGSGFWVTE